MATPSTDKQKTESFLLQIQKHLWDGPNFGRAAVMVGAGMSKNTIPLLPSAPRMPDWGKLSASFSEALTPESYELRVLPPLELAARYEARFGRVNLHKLIARMLPDEEHSPSKLHEKLLNLPWADVFTTNYDTLLERSLPQLDPARSYQVVRTVQSIAGSIAPRITKLHGSFPDTYPLIITEEDFRTYPLRFAPFVNMVQQSMMENIFCLVGFSGDDPNFTQWAGWVRDNLKENMPKIYLCGVFDSLDRSRLDYLSARNIAVVDLAYLLNPDDPKEDRHGLALDRMLAFLESGRPEDPMNWGQNRDLSPTSAGSQARDAKTIAACLKALRTTYPGWVVCPQRLRSRYWDNSVRPAIQSIVWGKLEEISLEERIDVLFEVSWALNLCHRPLIGEIQSILETVVNLCLDNQSRAGNEKLDLLYLTLLREYRYEFDTEKFEQLIRRLGEESSSVRANCLFGSGYCYEQCLAHWYRLEYSAFLEKLHSWEIEAGDPFWATRKASLMLMAGEFEQAVALLETTLAQLRKRISTAPSDKSLLSREAWTMYLLQYQFNRKSGGNIEVPGRWEQLARHHCDPFAELRGDSGIELRHSKPPVTEREGFDPGRVTTSRHFGTPPEVERQLAAYIPLRLREAGACPLVFGHYRTYQEEIGHFLSHFLKVNPALFFSLCVQTHNHKFVELMTRTDLARLNRRVASNWIEKLAGTLQFLVDRVESLQHRLYDGPAWDSMLCTVLDILSKLAIRATLEQSRKLLEIACGLYINPNIRVSFQMAKPVESLFSRVLESCDSSLISEHLPSLLRLPLGNAEGPVALLESWPEPFECLRERRELSSTGTNSELDGRIMFLVSVIEHGSNERKGNRVRSMDRLLLLHDNGLLTNEQARAFTNAIWAKREKGSGLPDLCNRFLPSMAMYVPSPKNVDPKQLVRDYLESIRLSSLPDQPEKSRGRTFPPSYFSPAEHWILAATKATKSRWLPESESDGIQWESSVAKSLIDDGIEFANMIAPDMRAWLDGPPSLFNAEDEFRNLLLELSTLLLKQLLPYLDHNAADHPLFRDYVISMNDLTVPIQRNCHMLLWFDGQDRELIEDLVLSGLRSNSKIRVAHSYVGVRDWALMAKALGHDDAGVPDSVRRQLFVRVMTPQSKHRSVLLDCVASLIAKLPGFFSDEEILVIADAIGLEMQMTIDPEESDETGPMSHNLLTSLHALGASLFQHFELAGSEIPSTLKVMREQANGLNLPEIRKAWSLSSAPEDTSDG